MDEEIGMLFEDGVGMLFEDGTGMVYEFVERVSWEERAPLTGTWTPREDL